MLFLNYDSYFISVLSAALTFDKEVKNALSFSDGHRLGELLCYIVHRDVHAFEAGTELGQQLEKALGGILIIDDCEARDKGIQEFLALCIHHPELGLRIILLDVVFQLVNPHVVDN